MNLQKSYISQGNYLFRYRSYFPILLFVLAVPFIYDTSNDIYLKGWELTLTVLSVAVSVLGFFIRSYAIGTTPKGTSGRNTKEQVAEQLNTKGIYSVVRHPLYLGNYLIRLGIVFFTFSISFALIFSLLFWIYYERIMSAEEDFIEKKFGDSFQIWADKTPPFFPGFKNYSKSSIPFSLKTVMRREYSGFLATVLSFTYIDYLRCFFFHNNYEVLRLSAYFLFTAGIIALVLRTLKHNTNWLNQEGRS